MHGRLLGLGLVVVAGCGDEVETLPSDLDACADGTTLGYADVAPILDTYCTDCHASTLTGDDRQGAPVMIDFDTAAGARAVRFLAWTEIFSGRMPKTGGPVPMDDALTLHAWLSCDAPE